MDTRWEEMEKGKEIASQIVSLCVMFSLVFVWSQYLRLNVFMVLNHNFSVYCPAWMNEPTEINMFYRKLYSCDNDALAIQWFGLLSSCENIVNGLWSCCCSTNYFFTLPCWVFPEFRVSSFFSFVTQHTCIGINKCPELDGCI